jgi:hypothetical protein
MGSPPLVLLLVASAVALLILTRHLRRRRRSFYSDFLVEREEAEAGLEASLAEVSQLTGNPREQVTAAYHRLLVALDEAGAPRFIHEAPHEYLHRVLGPLGVRAEPLHQLTSLYVIAQFSTRPVTENHRNAAVHALEVSLADLREVARPDEPSDLFPEPAGVEG